MESSAKAIENLRADLRKGGMVRLYPDEIELVLEALEALEKPEEGPFKIEYKQTHVATGEVRADWRLFNNGYETRADAETEIELVREEDRRHLETTFCEYRVVPA